MSSGLQWLVVRHQVTAVDSGTAFAEEHSVSVREFLVLRRGTTTDYS